MHTNPVPRATIIACALAACTATEPPLVLPGRVDAPPPPMMPAGDTLLTQGAWAWQGTLMSDDRKIVPDAPERYTLEFAPGGAVAVRADCNRGSGSYLLDGGALTFGPIAVTRAMCAPGSSDAEFLKGLSQVSGQLFRGNELFLTLRYDSGSMRFAPARP